MSSVLDLFPDAVDIRMPAGWLSSVKAALREQGLQDLPDESRSGARLVGLADADYSAPAVEALRACRVHSVRGDAEAVANEIVVRAPGQSLRVGLIDPSVGDPGQSLMDAARYDLDVVFIGTAPSDEAEVAVRHWAGRLAEHGTLVVMVLPLAH